MPTLALQHLREGSILCSTELSMFFHKLRPFYRYMLNKYIGKPADHMLLTKLNCRKYKCNSYILLERKKTLVFVRLLPIRPMLQEFMILFPLRAYQTGLESGHINRSLRLRSRKSHAIITFYYLIDQF